MSLPMIGTWTVVVSAARPFTIHGDAYLELHVSDPQDGSNHIVRVPQHALASAPGVGERVTMTFLMGQVTEVRPAP